VATFCRPGTDAIVCIYYYNAIFRFLDGNFYFKENFFSKFFVSFSLSCVIIIKPMIRYITILASLHGADDLEFPPHFFLFRVIITLSVLLNGAHEGAAGLLSDSPSGSR